MLKCIRYFSAIVVVLFCYFSELHAQAADSSSGDGEGENGSFTPGSGFKIVKTKHGEMNFRVFTYVRYLNQEGLDSSYTDAFGNTTSLDKRQDAQLNKVSIQFLGWVMDPKFRYLFYVWSQNTSQGLGAQVVVGGFLTYKFDKHFNFSGGIFSLPTVRTTEGTFPCWLTVDNRSIADEYFRGSYTTGFWAEGEIIERLKYKAMIGNNLSQLGVDAGQLNNGFNTLSAALNWYPSTGEFGEKNGYGDFEGHQIVASRFGVHFSRSPEDRQGAPKTDAFENVTLRLSDGNSIFTPDLFGNGIQVYNATYHMSSLDAGIKYEGYALEGEFYWRWMNGFTGPGTESLTFDMLVDNGFQLMGSSMLLPKTLQLYVVWAKVFGQYGIPWEVRGGVNFYPFENQVVRCNLECIHTEHSPVGGLSLPYQVGGTGNIFDFNLMLDL